MARRVVYAAGLGCFVATLAILLTAMVIPEWLVWTENIPATAKPRHSYGLNRYCTTLPPYTVRTCRHFPSKRDCRHSSATPTLCPLWRTAAWAIEVSLLPGFSTLFCFAFLLLTGKQQRQRGWKVLGMFIAVTALCQAVGLGVMGWQERKEVRFQDGWGLGKSFWLSVVGIGGLVGTAVTVLTGVAGYWGGGEEEGYELLREERDYLTFRLDGAS